jgi:CHAT domain-containing protein/tetratricopeptide (TPR) repeat protein
MRILFVTIFLLSVLGKSYSQAWEETNRQVLKLTEEQQYDSALTLAKKALVLAEKESGKISLPYSASLNNLAVLYKELNQWKNAEFFSVESVQIVRKLLKENDPDFIRCLENLAELYAVVAKYSSAESIYLELNNIIKKEAGASSDAFLSEQEKLALLYQKAKEYNKAEAIFIYTRETFRKTRGDTSINYIESVNNLGRLYYHQGNYKRAESLLQEILTVRGKTSGENHPDYAATLFDLGVVYETMNDLEKAESNFLRAMQIWKNYLEDFHDDFSNAFVSLAKLNNRIGKYKMTVSLYEQFTNGLQQVVGSRHINLAAIMHETARAYSYLSQYDTAISLFKNSAAIQKSIEGINTEDYANNMYHMGQAYMMRGQYDSARLFLSEAEKIRKTILGKESYDYAASLYGLGFLYAESGDYPKAEKMLIACRNILTTIKGQRSADYAKCNGALANLYIELNLLNKAEPLLLENLATESEVLGTHDPGYASTMNDLGGLYNQLGDVDKAEKYYLQALKLREEIFGKFHTADAESLNNLAGVYETNEEYKKAIDLYTEAAEIIKKLVGENNADYSNVLSNMALTYERTGNYSKAESLLISANEINRKILGEQHPQYSLTLRNLAALYFDQQRYDLSESLLKKAKDIQLLENHHNFSMLTEKEKTSSVDYDFGDMSMEHNLALKQRSKSPDLMRFNFNELLLLKSLSLSDTKNIIAAIRNSADPTVRTLFSKWQELKTLLAKQYSLPLANRITGIDTLEIQADDIERKLNDLSSEFRDQQQLLKIKTEDVRRKLNDDEAAIEFVNFKVLNIERADTILYAAYILTKKDSSPIFVPLCREEQLGKYFSSVSGSSGIKSIYRSEVTDEDSSSSISGDSLFALIWKPLLPPLEGIKRIDYSPAGLLNRVAFHALPAGDNQLLIDKYDLNRYTSTRQLALPHEESKAKNKSIVLFGNPTFTMDSISIIKNTTENENTSNFFSAKISRGGSSEPWIKLTGTAKEIGDIKFLFERNGISTSTYTQEKATEEKFKSLSGNSPEILHFATHGFFLPDPQKKRSEGFALESKNAFTIAEDPMLRSGLVLAGANRVWTGKSPIEKREDGIVTAYEISQLDLRNTDLVALSACETALGDIKGTEGVFGLQRAFKLAGVKNMLLSLWKVPDAETAELMSLFYGHYLKGLTPRESLYQVQREMRKKYSPFYWAAFVVIE